MKRSLSVFVPIHDTYRWLDSVVAELLEVLPELTPRFEVLLLDDGNAEDAHAVETAHELARRYPQVRVVRPALTTGRAATLRAGLCRSQGEVILLWSDGCLIEPHGFRKLWRMIDEYAAVIAHAAPAAQSRNWTRRLMPWGQLKTTSNPPASANGLHMLHRQVAERLWTESAVREELPAALSRRGYRWCELELRPAGAMMQVEPTLTEVGLSRGDHLRADRAAPAGKAARGPTETRRPKYLARLRNFALGQ